MAEHAHEAPTRAPGRPASEAGPSCALGKDTATCVVCATLIASLTSFLYLLLASDRAALHSPTDCCLLTLGHSQMSHDCPPVLAHAHPNAGTSRPGPLPPSIPLQVPHSRNQTLLLEPYPSLHSTTRQQTCTGPNNNKVMQVMHMPAEKQHPEQ
jgi:hypothetical protein